MALVDPYGRELRSYPTRLTTEMQGTVRIRDQWSSYPSVKLTPEKLAGILREADVGDILRQAELAQEMEEKDAELSAALHTRKLAVQGLPWEVEPASPSAKDKEIADHVRKNLQDLKLRKAILTLMDAIWKGFACLEIQWVYNGEQVWATRLEWVPQQRFTFLVQDQTINAPVPRVPNLLTDDAPIYGIEVKPYQIIYHRAEARSGLAQRGGLFRPCAYPYVFKNFATKDWLIFLEKYGQPTRVGKYPAGAQQSDIEILKQAVQNLGVDAAAVIPESMLIELIEAKTAGASSDIYDRFISERVNKAYEKCILGQTATTEGTPGKLGGEEAQSQVRRDLLKADAEDLSETITDQLIWPMVGANYGFEQMLPKFRLIVEEPEDLQMLSQTHKTLVEIGVPIPLSFAQKKYGIPAPKAGEEILRLTNATEPEPDQDTPAPDLALKKKLIVPVGSRRLAYPALPDANRTRLSA